MYFYCQLMFSSRLLNDTVITEENVALDDRVINDAMKNLCKKASITIYYSALCLKKFNHNRKTNSQHSRCLVRVPSHEIPNSRPEPYQYAILSVS